MIRSSGVFQIDGFIHNTEPRLLWLFGVVSLFLYAAFKVLFPEVGDVAERLMVIAGLVLLFGYMSPIRRDPVVKLGLIAACFPLLSWALGMLHHPELLEAHPKLDRTAKWFLFVPVAILLAANTKRTLLLWSVAALCLVLGTLVRGGGARLGARYSGHTCPFWYPKYAASFHADGRCFAGFAGFRWAYF